MTEREMLAAQAARWVARMDAGEWSDSDEAALNRWLEANGRARGALLEAHAAWLTLDRRVVTAARPDLEQGPRRLLRRSLLAGLLAASVAGILAVPLLTDRAAIYQTAVGDVRRVRLPDGSHATINTASRVVVDFGHTERDARVDAGEAWFEVQKNPARPFVVRAGGVRVEAVGTAFSVRRTANRVDVLVTEGRVRITSPRGGPNILLTAGERASISPRAAATTAPVGTASIERALAWRTGRIDFEGISVAAAVVEFNRYNRASLVLADSRIAGELLDGTFRIDDAEGFARAVGKSFAVPVDTSDPRQITIGTGR